MRKYLIIGVIAVVLVLGYFAVRTFAGKPVSISEAEKAASSYIKKSYPGKHFKIGDGVYEPTFNQYEFNIEDSSGNKVNQLVISGRLGKLEDINLTSDLNNKVNDYIFTQSNLEFEKMKVSSTVFFSTNNFKRSNELLIILTGKKLDQATLAQFGKNIVNWGKENGLVFNQLTINFDNSKERYILSANNKQLGEQDYAKLIKKK